MPLWHTAHAYVLARCSLREVYGGPYVLARCSLREVYGGPCSWTFVADRLDARLVEGHYMLWARLTVLELATIVARMNMLALDRSYRRIGYAHRCCDIRLRISHTDRYEPLAIMLAAVAKAPSISHGSKIGPVASCLGSARSRPRSQVLRAPQHLLSTGHGVQDLRKRARPRHLSILTGARVPTPKTEE